jgi:parallel beta-helix repeat protein
MTRITLTLALILMVQRPAMAGMGLVFTDLYPGIALDGKTDLTKHLKSAIARASENHQTLYLPAGIYPISGPIMDLGPGHSLQLKGEGIRATRIVLTAPVAKPICSLHGTPREEPPYAHLTWFSCDEISFFGGKNRAQWFRFDYVAHAYFTRCEFAATDGSVMSGKSWWDSTFNECSFAGCGSVARREQAIRLDDMPEGTRGTWCNNICFNTCRFEACPAGAIYMGRKARKNRLVSCKFDRCDTNVIVMREAECNIVTASQFVGTDGTAIVLDSSTGILVTSNIFERTARYGVLLSDSRSCVIALNTFGPMGGQQACEKGNIYMDPTSRANYIAGNTTDPMMAQLAGLSLEPKLPGGN